MVMVMVMVLITRQGSYDGYQQWQEKGDTQACPAGHVLGPRGDDLDAVRSQ